MAVTRKYKAWEGQFRTNPPPNWRPIEGEEVSYKTSGGTCHNATIAVHRHPWYRVRFYIRKKGHLYERQKPCHIDDIRPLP